MHLWHIRNVKNFHLPLPDDTYEHLMEEVELGMKAALDLDYGNSPVAKTV